MRKVRLRPKAKNDLDKIWEYTSENWGQSQATYYLEKIEHAFDLIASNPYMGKSREKILAGLHVFTVEKHMVCYLVDEDQIDVVRILHKRMDADGRLL